MKLRRRTLTVWIALFAAPSFAQTIHTFDGASHAAPWESDLDQTGRFGRAVAGDFDGDGVMDAVVTDGGTPFLLIDVDALVAPSDVGVVAHDLDTLHAGGLAGRDALAIVNAEGLRLAWFDPSLGVVASSSLNSSVWAGAKEVRAADLNVDGKADLLGLAADGVTFLRLNGTGGSPTGFAPAASFTIDDAAESFTLLQWDADPQLEVAVLTGYGVELYELDGTLIDLWQAALPGGVIAPLRQTGQTDRLVWITAYGPPCQQMLMVLSPSGIDDFVDLGALDAFAGVTRDFDLDGDDDLLISHRYSQELLWFENQRDAQHPDGASFTSDPSGMQLFEVGPPGVGAPENESWPVVADFDGDGDADVLFAAERALEIRVFRGQAVDESQQTVSFDSASYAAAAGAQQGTLTLGVLAPAAPPSGATHLEVELWSQADASSFVDAAALALVRVPLQSGTMAVDLPIPESQDVFHTLYHVQLRCVDLDGGGNVVARHPAQIASFAVYTADVQQLENEYGSAPATPVAGSWPEDSACGAKVVPRNCLRRMARGHAPAPPPGT